MSEGRPPLWQVQSNPLFDLHGTAFNLKAEDFLLENTPSPPPQKELISYIQLTETMWIRAVKKIRFFRRVTDKAAENT
jgi:hypothetical protein